MTLQELKNEICQYLYMEDTEVIDVILASVIGNIISPTNPIWMVIVGAPSGGKTQLILPLEKAQPSGKKYIHRITDLTPNTFLSGASRNAIEIGADGKSVKVPIETSLLKRIGTYGIMLFPDLTSLFSKEPTELQEILGTLRHIYDGALTKMTGTGLPIEWEGRLGIIGASTSDIYRHTERFSSMGERLMYYRMKPVRDKRAATEMALSRQIGGKELDEKIATLYSEYIKGVLAMRGDSPEKSVSKQAIERIREAACYASLLRTGVYVAYRNEGARIERIPESEMPMRTALQLMGLARGFVAINNGEDMSEEQIAAIERCAWSMGNDERRKTLQILASGTDEWIKTGGVGAKIMLETDVARGYLLQLSAVGIVARKKNSDGQDEWKIIDNDFKKFVVRMEGIEPEDDDDVPIQADDFDNF